MKQLKFLETKRTPRYSLRKFSIGMVSVLLGVTIFGINFTNHSVKAATPVESVESSNSSPNSNSQQTSAAVLTTAEQTKGINAIGAVKVPDSQNDANKVIDAALNKKNSEINGATTIDQTTKDKLNQPATDAADKAKEAITKATTNNDVATEQTDTQKAASATGKVQQSSASNNATANNSTEAATTSQSAPKMQGSAGSGASGSSATGVVSRSQDSNSQAASATSSAATDSQAAPETQVPAPAASQRSESANSGNATSSPASQAGTVSANHTAIGTTPSSQTVSVDEATSPTVQSRILMTNLAVRNSDTADTLPKSTQTYTLVSQPLMSDYLNDGNKDNTWVYKTIKLYKDSTLDTIFNTTPKRTFFGNTIPKGIIPSNPDKYFFAAYVDYSTSYHRVILLARSQHPNDHNLYTYVVHTGSQDTSSSTVAPDAYTQEFKSGVTGSKYNLILKNYQGKSYTVSLEGFKDGDWGLLPVFDGGLLDRSNTYDQNDKAAEKESISLLASMIPQETSTKVRYVDQATGKDIVQPMEISGFGYQGFKVNGEAPTVKGYHLVSSPKSLGLPYEDGTIAPYKVGQTYDLALSDSVVIKQTVIHTDGTVRATPYYNGSPLTNASKVLGRESYNDHMSFGTPGGKYYTYTNRIGQVGDSYIYYYAKDSDPKGSEMRLHFIDVTGVNNSSYAPSDGPELDADKVQTIQGNIGENYSFTYTVPKGYDQVGTSDVTGTYSVTHHDAYVYVKIDRHGAKATIENLTHLNNAQKQAAEAAIDQATDLNTMNQATSTATTLDGDMGKLSDLTADLTNTNNYKYASDKPKSAVATDYTNANVLLDKTAGQNADDATVLKLIDQINTHKSSLDGDKNLSAAEKTISGLTHLNDAQRSAANRTVTSASDLTGLKTAVGNAQSVDSAMSDLQTAVNQANEAKTTNNYLQASADKQGNLNSAVQNAQAVLAATGANDSADQVKALTKSVNDAVDALDGDANTNATKDAAKNAIDQAAKAKNDAIDKSN
ncbi:YSIRK-type signal peptide-containing protein, partial [Lactobacillus gallinarum]|uniref:YSIRK-type signal peptide-containing protein n=1 Tax=Lactobacillus gallinarum TaxID=52242 RepID=UPI0024BB3C23